MSAATEDRHVTSVHISSPHYIPTILFTLVLMKRKNMRLTEPAPVNVKRVEGTSMKNNSDRQALYRYWLEMREATASGDRNYIPVWKSVNPLDLKPWLGRLQLLEFEDEIGTFRVRLHGTILREWFGTDLTGMSLSEIDEIYGSTLVEKYSPMLDATEPMLLTNKSAPQKKHLHFNQYNLPFSKDGRSVSFVLILIEPLFDF